MFCKSCGTQMPDNSTNCPSCGARNVADAPVYNKGAEDKTSIGLAILSFFIPLFGFIYGGIKYKEAPKSSKTYLICAGVSVGLSILTSIIGSMLAASAVGSLFELFLYA